MYLIVHASVGAVVGQAMPLPAESFAAGFASHFVLDMMPHGDESLGRMFIRAPLPLRLRAILLASLFIIDAVAGISVVTIGWVLGLFPNGIGAFSGAVGAILPDFLSGLSMVTDGKFLPPFDKFHRLNHTLTKLEAPVYAGGTLQVITLVSVWVIPFVGRWL